MDDPNPLLGLQIPIPFDEIRPEHVVPAVDALLSEARARAAALLTEENLTVATVLDPLDALTNRLEFATDIATHLETVATSPSLRVAINASQPLVNSFQNSLSRNEALYHRVSTFAQSEEGRTLTGASKRYLEKELADFKRQGAELTRVQKDRLSAIDAELTTATLRHSQNVLDATCAFEWVTDEQTELAGLPPSAVQAAVQSAKDKGLKGARFTLQAPSYESLMANLDNPQKRQEFYLARMSRASSGTFDNGPLTAHILELRHEKARMLGFDNFADLILSDRMAKTGAAARSFIETLRERTQSHFESENEQLQHFRRGLEGPSAPALQPWDIAYYAEKQRRALYDFDEESLRPYFSLPRVLEGRSTLAARLYGLTIDPRSDVPTWHVDVQAYRLADRDGTELATFFLDVFPRESKRGGAWMQPLFTGGSALRAAPHIAVLAANLTPPIGERPAQLTHRDVETLFHEFGHLMHHCLSQVPVRALAGTRVAWDFVEMPSMLMENWCWEKDVLALFAHHEQTLAPLPDELFDRMRRARTYRAANAMMRQLGFAAVDLDLHTRAPWASTQTMLDFARATLASFSPAPLPESHALITSFSHLFGDPVGYAAGYYSYKWAEVLEADAFSRFANDGIFNPSMGARFRDLILSQGNTRDPLDMYVDFMGRPANLEPLFQRAGL